MIKKWIVGALSIALTALAVQVGPASAQTFKPQNQIQGSPAAAEAVIGGKSVSIPTQICVTVDANSAIVPCTSGSGSGDASAAKQDTQITAAQLTNTTLGAVTASPTANTIGDRLKTINTTLVGGIPVTGTFWQATQPVSGTVGLSGTLPAFGATPTVNLGTIGTASTAALQTTGNTALTTINTTLGTPFQAGGSIGNTSFAATQATASNLNAQVQGNVGNATADSGNPIKIGGIYSASGALSSLTVGNRSDAQTDANGNLRTRIVSVAQTGVDGLSNSSAVGFLQSAVTNSSGSNLILGTGGWLFNGTTWDRARGDLTGGAWVQGPASNGSAATGKPVLIGGSDGTNARTLKTATDGTLLTDTRNVVVKGTFGTNVTTAYSGFADVGGVATISTGLPSGTVLEACRLFVKTPSSYVTTSSTMLLYLFDANPSGSTLTDNTASSIAAADVSKTAMVLSAAAAGGGAGGVVTWTINSANCPLVAVDASGNLYAAAVPTGAFQVTNTAALYWTFEARY